MNQTFTNDKMAGGKGNNMVTIDQSGTISIKDEIVNTSIINSIETCQEIL